ncbi:hypothetical protein SETIT_8G063100v2 [Setaria italica]|uniref:Protein kinase domain-containing protein n=3 Tax=Setaria italica TaxID=4555 RepID=A0A368S4Z8_SETIT|nr:hypothetical protein SETIT_8G063100v2 [Setaria italica]
MATLFAHIAGAENPKTISGCATFCPKVDDIGGVSMFTGLSTGKEVKRCSSASGDFTCCKKPLFRRSRLDGVVEAKWFNSGMDHNMELEGVVSVLVAEEGWVDDNGLPYVHEFVEAPLLLEWEMTVGDAPKHDNCSEDVRRMLCKSEHTSCSAKIAGYVCRCDPGYDGNPYLEGGCQDINECKLPSEMIAECFGECFNTIGSYQCLCPPGTIGNPLVKGGCVHYNFTTEPMAEQMIGWPNCSTTCGSVHVPYPFGIGPECSWPGFNLTCNTSYNPPMLFLDSNNAFRVIDILLRDSTVRVTQQTFFAYYSCDNESVSKQLEDIISEPYMLSARNEFILYQSGVDVRATMHGEYRNGGGSSSNTSDSIIADCTSNCSSVRVGDHGAGIHAGDHCYNHDGFCRVPISTGSTPKKLEFKCLNPPPSGDILNPRYALAFISEEGLSDHWYRILNRISTGLNMVSPPLVLRWAVKQGISAPSADSSGQCPVGVASLLCKSEHSICRHENGGFTCYCSTGYHGNPYIADGCQDIDECNITAIRNSCFGDCNNLHGSFECRCERGTHGNPFKSGGCVRSPTGLIIGLSVASGPALLLLVLGILLATRKIKQRRIKELKQKYFKQNRGQLLQQLVSQNADIAERMIIPVDELAKATNNFDKARVLGGGGHGIVYKGILSDLHVVAIKKSKITVQKEIDEFINEVAILSQINHKNVVKLFGCCLETEVPLLVYEFISNGTLHHHLHVEGPRSLSWGNRLRIAAEIASSLAYLHSSVSIPIIHRDIKSNNILLDDTLTSKVSDFGASKYIPVEQTGLTTKVQGTIGYLDPMYFYTGRLTEKSDVFSFGVILVELLTRKKPSYLTSEGDGLVSHFINLFAEGNLVQVIDPQVIEEGGEEVEQVAALAASCINLRGEERPTMRQVEHTLEGLRGSKMYKNNGMVASDFMDDGVMISSPSSTIEGQRLFEESSRRYSLEQEMIMSERYPR